VNKNSVYIIAEAGVNHNGEIAIAHQLIDSAKNAGADAVKFQTFTAETLVTRTADMADYQKASVTKQKTQFDMLKSLELKPEDYPGLKEHANQLGIEFLSTPFDCTTADFLEPFVSIYKIGSSDTDNYPFLSYLAKKKKPIILSTGMSTIEEIDRAVKTITPINPHLSLLHCTTSYPCPFSQVNLSVIPMLSHRYNLPIGFSDHTEGIEAAVAAVGLGAQIIEKHFTLSKKMDGPDHKASLEPVELSNLVQSIRNVSEAIGSAQKTLQPNEIDIRKIARKSIVYLRDMFKNDILTEKDIIIKRPGTGIPPSDRGIILDKKLAKNVFADTLVSLDDVII
jgi:N-acetylneuraminate synthase